MWTISKSFDFSAAHFLPLVPDDHPCGFFHGHNYTVTIVLISWAVDEREGWVTDYRELDSFKAVLKEKYDHTTLNDVVPNPTSENMAKHFHDLIEDKVAEGNAEWEWGSMLHYVEVSETPKTTARYFGEPPSLTAGSE